jgi:hypothetical protein
MDTEQIDSAIAEISNNNIKEKYFSILEEISTAREELDIARRERVTENKNTQAQQYLVSVIIPKLAEDICQLLRLIEKDSSVKFERNFSLDQARKALSLMYFAGCTEILNESRESEIFLQVKETISCYEIGHPVKHHGIFCVYSIVGLNKVTLQGNFTKPDKLEKKAGRIINRAISLNKHKDLKVGVHLIELFTKLCSDYCCFFTKVNFKIGNDNSTDSGKIKTSRKARKIINSNKK